MPVEIEEGYLDEQDRMCFRQAGEELLWTLPDPIPAQMAQRDDGSFARTRGIAPR